MHEIQRYQANREDVLEEDIERYMRSMNYRIFTDQFVVISAYFCNKQVSILSKTLISKYLIIEENGGSIASS